MGLYTSAIEESNRRELSNAETAGQFTRGQIDFVGNQATQFGGLRSRAQAGINNSVNRARRVSGAQGASVAATELNDQAAGSLNSGDVVTNALRRAKARVGVVNRGDKAARNQRLTDRLTQVRAGIARQGSAIQMQTKGLNIKAGVNVGASEARGRGDAAQAGAFGSAAGGIAATLMANKRDSGGFFNFKVGGH